MRHRDNNMEDDGFALFSRKPASKRPRREAEAAAAEDPAPAEPEPEVATSDDDDAAPPPAAAAPAAPAADAPRSFAALGLSPWLARACAALGMAEPTPVQAACIPAIIAGRDVVGVAQTGSGKTAAFALPILHALAPDPYGVFALVLTPTRELAGQLAEQFAALGAGAALRAAVVVGGLDMAAQARALARRPHVVVATPGRLAGLLAAEPALGAGFRRAAFLVLDEADRLLDPTFEPELAAILPLLPARRQTLLFTATMTRALGALQAAALRDAFYFEAAVGLAVPAGLRQEYLLVPAKVKEVYLVHLLRGLAAAGPGRSAVVFAATRRRCALLAALLAELGLPAAALHAGLPQRARAAALARFRAGAPPVLLATDVAARGLDIPSVDLVINYDLPALARDYVHRVGRAARAGRPGRALTLVSQHDAELLRRVEALVGGEMGAAEVDEAEALKGITAVYAARRAAALRVADDEARAAGARGGGGAAAVARRQAKPKRGGRGEGREGGGD